MAISVQDFWKTLFYVFLIVSLPIYYFYNLLYVLDYVPSIPLFGYPTFIHLSSIPVLIYALLNQKKFFSIGFFYIIFIFLIQILIYTSVGFFISSYSFDKEVLVQSLLLLYYLLIYSVAGFSIYYYSIIGKKIWIYILYAYLLSIIYIYFLNGSIYLNLQQMNMSVETISYQTVSEIFFFTWYIYYSGTVNSIDRLKSILVILLILIASGSRSEFVGIMIALVYVFILNIIKLESKDIKSIILGFAFILLISLFYSDFIIESFINSRQFSLTKLDEDTSLAARKEILEYNLQIIKNHMILGEYGSHFQLGKGYYIHNFLSAWQQYGLLGFILYSLLIILPFIISSSHKIKSHNKNIDGIVLITTYVMILALSTKSVYWDKVGFSLGAILYYFWSKRKKPILTDD